MEPLITAQDVATLLGISLEKVYQMVGLKEIPCVKIGRLYRFQRPQIEQWITDQIQLAISK